jgi:hypothetical protein
MAKYLLIAAVVISLVTAGLGYKNYSTLSATKEELASTSNTLLTTKKSLDTATKDLASTKTTLTATTTDKEKLTADLAAAQSDLSTAKSQAAEAQKASTDKDAQIATLTAERDKAVSDLVKVGDTQAPPVAADNPQIKEQETLIASLQEKLKDNEAQMVEVRKREDDRKKNQMREGLEGRVLAVNPAWNFVVLSIGDKQGVVNNAELLLKRGGQYLGKVRITSVEPSTSIADIVANTLPSGVAVQPGDSVIFQQATTEN